MLYKLIGLLSTFVNISSREMRLNKLLATFPIHSVTDGRIDGRTTWWCQ